jgi:hypothetical protein
MPESDEQISDLSTYLQRVANLRREWNLRPDDEVWFRGETKHYEDSKLKPGLYRPIRDASDPIGSVSKIKDVREILKQEYLLFCDFQHDAEQFLDRKSYEQDKDWDDYFLMQHHGALTRLLDWTTQPLLALFFALQDIDKSSDARVFLLEPNRMMTNFTDSVAEARHKRNWRKYLKRNKQITKSPDEWEESYLPLHKSDREHLPMPKLPLVLDFDHNSRRINAQGSRFIIYGTATDSLVRELNREPGNRAIEEIIIPSGFKQSLENQLVSVGITAALAFPDLDGVGKSVAAKWHRWATSDY